MELKCHEKGVLWALLLFCTPCMDKTYIIVHISFIILVYMCPEFPFRIDIKTGSITLKLLMIFAQTICSQSYYMASDNRSQNDNPAAGKKVVWPF